MKESCLDSGRFVAVFTCNMGGPDKPALISLLPAFYTSDPYLLSTLHTVLH